MKEKSRQISLDAFLLIHLLGEICIELLQTVVQYLVISLLLDLLLFFVFLWTHGGQGLYSALELATSSLYNLDMCHTIEGLGFGVSSGTAVAAEIV